jgi:hypothetical protein
MFEHRRDPLAPTRMFARRVARHGAISGGIVLGSLAIGAAGYHGYGALPWIDALLNAAMILTGMGPVDALRTTGGKLFATAYALFSGVAFLTTVAVLYAPVIHRFLHRFHLELDDDRRRPR